MYINNPLRKPVDLGRYDRLLIQVLHAKNLPLRPHVHVNVQVDDMTPHRTEVSTQLQDPHWSKEEFVAPFFFDSRIEVIVFHDDEHLGESQAPIQRLLDGLVAEKTCELTLWWPELDSEDPIQYSSSVTLHISPLPPFIADSLPQYHLPPTPSSCQFLHESLLSAGPPFNPSIDEKTRIVAALAIASTQLESGLRRIRFLDSSLVVKWGGQHIIREAMAMMYIRLETSIPVPMVRQCFQHGGKTYLVMDRANGQSLDACLSEMSDQHLKNVTMGSWPSGPYDNVLFDPPPLREFRDMQEFQAYWIYRLGTCMGLPEVPSALREVGGKRDIFLSHGDLAPRNIMVEGGEITSILDWETLGWYPDFWELMTATRGSSLSPNWANELSFVLGKQTDSSQQYARVLFDVFFRPWAQ